MEWLLSPSCGERERSLSVAPSVMLQLMMGLCWGGNFISCHCKEKSKPAKCSLLAEAEEEEEEVTY